MSEAAARLAAVSQRIAQACRCVGRAVDDVQLIAVSKRVPALAVREMANVGQRDFGESYVQEAIAKIDALQDLNLTWHFIGPVQANKTALIARHFDWVHSVDRLRVAQRLSEQRDALLPPLKCLIQVNISGEPQKHGVAPDALPALVKAVQALPQLAFCGLMGMAEDSDDEPRLLAQFGLLAGLARALDAQGIPCPVLSMGMSGDLEQAIAQGATHIRVGAALFGPRLPSKESPA
jgi:PLP dependent protein